MEIIDTKKCKKCKQININQTGIYECEKCGLPTMWDDSFSDAIRNVGRIRLKHPNLRFISKRFAQT